jgi:hypothetical protein
MPSPTEKYARSKSCFWRTVENVIIESIPSTGIAEGQNLLHNGNGDQTLGLIGLSVI